ncbi:putative peptide (allatostatin/somatostatin)-like receptor [Schistosoma mansoni]|uniref:Putative peptide (Allatostatin/somatostatin)-like receptor n=1 Tax=Schistosoma mansoni TaxID=6183 RepID=G4VJR3_SCHMA|nr:putative peptide (allatostatin/somatostatin)-like receptor [Schistosoma mansoni]|eukprot:XP_018652268.1 putative peptide (allatostatin/somatostatin)-like receptor [Schistosoma mansoni]
MLHNTTTIDYSQLVGGFRAYLCPIIAMIGVIGNSFIILIFLKEKPLSRFSIYSIFLAIANMITLIMNTFIDDFLGRGLYYLTNHQFYFKLDTISKFWCKSVEYLSNTMYFTSSYLIVIFSIDRLLTIHKPIKFYSIYHKHWALIACLLVYFIGIISNSPLLFVQTLMIDISSRTNFTCRMISEHPIAKFTIAFETIVTFTIPFCLVLFLNIFICIELWKLKVHRTALLPADCSRNRMEMGRVFGHLALSTAFLLLYLPMVCFVLIRLSQTLSHVDRHKPYAMNIIDLSRLFSSVKDITYAVNFFLYLIFLRNFRHGFQRLICTVYCKKVSSGSLHRPQRTED